MAQSPTRAQLEAIPQTIQLPTEERTAYQKFRDKGWFTQPGAYVLVDGQFGSTGKGLAEQKLAHLGGERVTVVTTNAGPNSGHTVYNLQGEKIVTRQIPSFSVAMAMKKGIGPHLHLNAGAMIDASILSQELPLIAGTPFSIHPHATAILPKHYQKHPSLSSIASTQKGTGPALCDKILRKRFAVVENVHDFEEFPMSKAEPEFLGAAVIMVSTAQGFSLGLNSGFYPHATCRECTVQQALSDARIAARRLRKVITTHRVHPIRVGDTPLGSSGGWYPDQQELGWETLGVTPEVTTVTGRPRRIATWSDIQFRECLIINEPDAIFINFINYLGDSYKATKFVEEKVEIYRRTLARDPDFVMMGFGPSADEVDVAFMRDDIGQFIFKRLGKVDLAAAERSGHA